MAHGADLEQLARLRLDALRAVDDHDGGVRRHQRAVGVLGEVLMARRVQNVDAEAVILKLHNGRGDGDAALLFDLHPVGDGGAGVLFALDGARLCDGPAVEQEFSVSVVLPASGCEMIANVLRREISSCKADKPVSSCC